MKLAIVHKPGAALDALMRTLESDGHQVVWRGRDSSALSPLVESAKVEVVLWSVAASRSEQALRALHEAAAMLPIIILYCGEKELGDADLGLARGATLALDLSNTSAEGHKELRARLEAARRLRLRRSLPTRTGTTSLIAIGASTGGPQALAQLCGALPADFAGAFVVVQHIEPSFASTLVDSLSQQTSLAVCAAEAGTSPRPGVVHIAVEPDRHLVLGADRRFHYTREPLHAVHRPSVDVLFESLAQHWRSTGTAVLLTGMGKDGARGMTALRKHGWRTIAQDESSSVVYGMPRAARDLGGASEVLALAEIGPALLRG